MKTKIANLSKVKETNLENIQQVSNTLKVVKEEKEQQRKELMEVTAEKKQKEKDILKIEKEKQDVIKVRKMFEEKYKHQSEDMIKQTAIKEENGKRRKIK